MGGTFRDDPTARPRGTHVEGTVLGGRYRLLRLLGRGGMGEVYEAFDEELRLRVALKTLRPGAHDSGEALEWLKQELRVGRSVAHRNLCRLYDFGSADGVHFITMELLRGPTLAQHLEALQRPLTLDELRPIVEQICAGLAELHGRDVVHLDIKPSNVVLEDDRVVVTDFGLASLQRETALGGSPWYMAPEQVERKAIDLRADIFALGVLIFEALTRKLPFTGTNDDEIARSRLFSRPLELDPASTPRPLRRLVSQCLSKDPASRPQRVTDVALRFAGQEPRRGLAGKWVVALVALLTVGLGAGVVQRLTAPPHPPRVVVLPFDTSLPADVAWLAATGTQQAEAGLSASTDATLVPPLLAREALRDAALSAPWPVDFPDTLVRRLDFDLWLTGKVGRRGENFTLHLEWPRGSWDGDALTLGDAVAAGLDAFRAANGLKVDESARAAISRVPTRPAVAEACARGDLAVARYRWGEASHAFDQCLEGDALNIAAALRLAEVVERQFDRGAARPALKAAWDHRDVLTRDVRLVVDAKYARALGNWSDAVNALRQLPARAEVRFALAEALAASGQVQEARKTLDAEFAPADLARAAWTRARFEPGADGLPFFEQAAKAANAQGQRHLEAVVLLEHARRLRELRRAEAEPLARRAQLAFHEAGDALGAVEALYEVALFAASRGEAAALSELRAASKEAKDAEALVECKLNVLLAEGEAHAGANEEAKQLAARARVCLKRFQLPGLAGQASLVEALVNREEGFLSFLDSLAKEGDAPAASDEVRALARVELALIPLVKDELEDAHLALDATLPSVKDFAWPHAQLRLGRVELALSQRRLEDALREADLGLQATQGRPMLDWLAAQLWARKAQAHWLLKQDGEAHAALDAGRALVGRGVGASLLALVEARIAGKAETSRVAKVLEERRLWSWGTEACAAAGDEPPAHWGFTPQRFAVRLGQLQR